MDTTKMRIIGSVCCVVVVLALGQGLVNASQPSAGKLAQMGLSGAQIVSDSEAMQVRGMGFSFAWGRAYIKIGPLVVADDPTLATFGGLFAGGGSFAFAK